MSAAQRVGHRVRRNRQVLSAHERRGEWVRMGIHVGEWLWGIAEDIDIALNKQTSDVEKVDIKLSASDAKALATFLRGHAD